MVVRLGVLLIDKVCIVRADEFHAVFLRQFNEHGVGFLLQWERLPVSPLCGVFHFVALQLEVVVVAPHLLVPFYGFPCALDVAFQYFRRHLSGYACRTHYQPLAVSLEVFVVRPRSSVESVHPCV